MKNQPLLSIITITLNDFDGFHRTYISLKEIIKDEIQWIIKDGGSEKKEKKKIYDLLDSFDKDIREKIIFESSRDNGIYEAMNSCLDKACGKWLIFMNGGDEFESCISILELLKTQKFSKFKMIIGSTNIIENGKRFLNKAKEINNCMGINSYRMAAMHQSQIFNIKVYEEIRFRKNYKISGDHAYFWDSFNLIKDKNSIFIYPNVIANFYNNGISSKKGLKSLSEVIMSMLTIQRINFFVLIIASIKRLLVIIYYFIRSKFLYKF